MKVVKKEESKKVALKAIDPKELMESELWKDPKAVDKIARLVERSKKKIKIPLVGVEVDSLKGEKLAVIAKHLAEAEKHAADDKDGNRAGYEKRASQIKLLIWKKNYSI